MAREKQKPKVDEEEEEKQVLEVNGGDYDDDEANEDLSLKIVEKALLLRASKLSENNKILFDDDSMSIDDTGVIGKGVAFSSSSSLGAEKVVTAEKKRRKKKKIRMDETEDQSDVAAKEEKAEKIVEKVELKEKPVANLTAEDIVENVDPNAVQISENIVLQKLLVS